MCDIDIVGELMDTTLPLVSIACITYNHEKYIRQCLDGFVMQQTNFKFEIVIHDDASTDKTAEIIKEYCRKYPHLFCPIFQTQNKYSEKRGILVTYVFPKCRGKYFALCEGDDYWIDPLKLQKQVDFLRKNTEYVLTCHRFRVYEHENGIWKGDGNNGLFKDKNGVSFDCNFSNWITKTLTMLFRRDALGEYFNYQGLGRDTVLVYFLLKNGKLGYCFNEYMGVYRLNNGGVYGKQPLRKKILGDYFVWRDLYVYEPNKITRKGYYSYYASVFVLTHGTILFKEKMDVIKILNVPYFLLLKGYRLCFRLLGK